MAIGYDPSKVVTTVGGVPITNFTKDTFIQINYEGPAVTMRESLTGEGIYSIQRYRAATVTLTVEANSNAHAIFSALYQKQQLTGGGQFVFSIVDANSPDGTTVFTASAARLAQMPNQTFGAEASTTDYEILCTQINHLIAPIPTASIL